MKTQFTRTIQIEGEGLNLFAKVRINENSIIVQGHDGAGSTVDRTIMLDDSNRDTKLNNLLSAMRTHLKGELESYVQTIVPNFDDEASALNTDLQAWLSSYDSGG